MNISRNYSDENRNLQARFLLRVIYLLIFLCILVGILILAPNVLAADTKDFKLIGFLQTEPELPAIGLNMATNMRGRTRIGGATGHRMNFLGGEKRG
jgi:hypothetical protein